MVQEYEYNGKAMGTDFSIALIMESELMAASIAEEAIQSIHTYERIFSRFLETSELSVLNTTREMKVSEIFFEVLLEAQRLFLETRGVFNPLIQIGRFGYTKNFDDITVSNTTDEIDTPYNIDFETVGIVKQDRLVSLTEGQQLDFGGILKGFLAEKLCRKIKNSYPTVVGVIINIGGDIHTQGFDAHGKKFLFSIYNPITDTEIQTELHNMSLATSGTYKRAWDRDGTRMHHILDAIGTHNPATNIVSASILHIHGSTAEAYAKVYISLEREEAEKILDSTSYAYILITNTGQIHTHTI